MFKLLVIVIIAIVFIFELIVSLVNYLQRKKPIPEIVKGVYDQQKYSKWLSYSMETLWFSLIDNSINMVLLIALLISGVFGSLESWTNTIFQNPILRSLLFLAVVWVIAILINMPIEYYATFIIEEKYGFNKSTQKTFFFDQIKNMLLGLVLGGLLVAGVQTLYITFEGRLWSFILLAWVAISLVLVLLFTLNKVFVKIFNKLTPLMEGSLKTRIERLASKVGYEVKAISVMDASRRSTKLNAFFSGLGKTREVVLYDTLVEKMTEDEIEAVLAHELGHAVHKDVSRILIKQVFLMSLYMLIFGFIVQNTELAQTFGLVGAQFGFSLLLFFILIRPINLLLAIPQNYFSRKAEYSADAFTAEETDGKAIKSALVRLAQENLSNLNPHPVYVWLYYNHPALAERLKAIK